MNACNSKLKLSGFTLFELIIVLVIISTTITVILPYATRSNESFKIKQESLNVAEMVKYAVDLAINSARPTRIVLKPKDKSYLLEASRDAGQDVFEALDNYQGRPRYFSRNINIIDIEGFDTAGKEHFLIFDPALPWPNGSFSLSFRDAIITINIKGRKVEIEETSI
ncbi:Tfp pilus assembly protein FimT/FimU [Planctomycetota bacterium]